MKTATVTVYKGSVYKVVAEVTKTPVQDMKYYEFHDPLRYLVAIHKL